MNLFGKYEAPDAVNLSPRQAVVFYQSGDSSRQAVATAHDIDTASGQVRLKPGRLMNFRALREHLESFTEPLPPIYPTERCVGVYQDRLAWWVPAGKRAFFWQTQEEAMNRFDRVPLACPALVLVKRGQNDLRIFALKENTRPVASTKLYHAPFYNLDDDGKMCTGTLQEASRKEKNLCEFWERFFFHSAFTHAGEGSLVRKGTYLDLVKKMATADVFPAQQLVPANRTFEQALMAK